MVTTPDEHYVDEDLDRRSRNAFNIGLLIAVISGLTVLGTYVLQIISGDNYYAWITAVGILGGLGSMILGRKKKPFVAAMLMVSSLFILVFLYIILVDSLGTMLTIVIAIVSLGIALQTVPGNKLSRANIIIIVLASGLILLDQFWFTTRNAAPKYSENIVIIAGIITVLLLAFFVIRQYPTYSLRGKLIGATLAVAILAVAAVAIGVSFMTTNAITQEVGSNLFSQSKSQALTAGEYLARTITGLQTLSVNKTIKDSIITHNNTYTGTEDEIVEELELIDDAWATKSDEDPFVQSILNNEITEEFKNYRTIFPDAFEVMAVDKYGALIAATNRPDDYYEGEEDWFLETYDNSFGSSYISNPIYDDERDDWYFYVGIPVKTSNENGRSEISAIIRATVSINALADLLTAGSFGDTGRIELYFPYNLEAESDDIGGVLPPDLQEQVDEALLTGELIEDEDSRIILSLASRSPGEYEIHLSDLVPEIEALINDPTTDYLIGDHEGIENFVSAAAVNTLDHAPAVDLLDWTITSIQESDESLEPVANQQRLNTILGLIVVITAGAVAYYVGTSLSQPITNLTKTAQQVAQGDLTAQATVESQDEIGVLASSFNDMTGQLRESITTLEQRVQNRTQALATTVEVGRQLSTILDEDELITAVVNQVHDSFNYYQAQIYLLESDKETLTMASGTGEAGQQMLADDHKLQVGTGLVGRAAESNQVILVSDVTQDESWMPNPLLPDTQSETAVPIAIGDDILGVLDVQQNIINGLQQEDADLLQSVANQVAVALRNARLYKETQQRAQNEALLRNINQKISTTTDMKTAMKVAIRELGQATGSSETSIRLKIEHEENGS